MSGDRDLVPRSSQGTRKEGRASLAFKYSAYLLIAYIAI